MNYTRSAISSARLRGVIAAIATPVTEALVPDHDKFVTLARRLLEGGCDGLNVLGTTGEATSFTVEQRMGVMTAAANAGLPLKRLMVGTGAAAVGDAARLTQHAAALGFAGALVLPPFYYKGVSDAGVIAYIGAIAAVSGDLPIYLYNFPPLSGVPYTPALVRLLVKSFPDRIAGLKDSSGDHAYAREIAAIADTLDVFPSNEATLMEARNGPFAGCISATANLNAHYCAKAYRDGDEDALSKAVAIRRLFDGLPLIAGIKLLLAEIHGDATLARPMPPLTLYSEADAATLRARHRAIA
jgi:4-hydroxy-tetrahydrodipicolinate synthase